jgi:hypothetical protein
MRAGVPDHAPDAGEGPSPAGHRRSPPDSTEGRHGAHGGRVNRKVPAHGVRPVLCPWFQGRREVKTLTGTSCGARMPVNDPTFFDRNPDFLVTIESWILAGAPNN